MEGTVRRLNRCVDVFAVPADGKDAQASPVKGFWLSNRRFVMDSPIRHK